MKVDIWELTVRKLTLLVMIFWVLTFWKVTTTDMDMTSNARLCHYIIIIM